MRRTKIICTIGPASSSPAVLDKLIAAGMNVARLNFSHGTHDEKAAVIRDVRSAAGRANRPVAILQDLAGPKVRVGKVAEGTVLLQPGQAFMLTSRPVPGDASAVGVTYPDLPRDVGAGDTVLLSDGALELRVEAVAGPDIRCRVIVGGPLSSHKGINLPGRSLRTPALTAKDIEDLEFGLRQGVDYVALSFVRRAADLDAARQTMNRLNVSVPLIAKIEKHEALEHIDEIVAAADGIMVARGDLGVETPVERIPRVQKLLIRRANDAGKPVITATQMLRSMVENPRPTRAEVTDVANAILDGSDAVMLSEETAMGRYPVEAVEVMSRTAESTEETFPFREWTARYDGRSDVGLQEAVAHSACELAEQIGAAAIITCTQSGSTTRFVSKFRPAPPILAVTPDAATFRRLSLIWGAAPALLGPAGSEEEMVRQAVALAVRSGVAAKGQTVVVTAGLPLHEAGTTNLIRVVTAE